MQPLNVEDLPEPIMRSLEVIVQITRKLTGRKPPPSRRQRIALGVRKGTVYGKLTREEIYDDFS